MASITSLTGGGSTNSIYGNRNVLSGLASGLDTEAMIENAVSGYNLKIANLQQDYTMMEWEQEAYRSIIDKLVSFNTKYMSFSSSTNLMSNSFFTNSATMTPEGTYANLVSATGKPTSNVEVLGVKQLATAASYTVQGFAGGTDLSIQGKPVNLNDTAQESNFAGTLTLKYGKNGGSTVDLTLDSQKLLEQNITTGEQFAEYLNELLTEKKADVKASYSNGSINFEDTSGGHNVWISHATGNIHKAFEIRYNSAQSEKADKSINIGTDPTQWVKNVGTNWDKLTNTEYTVTLDGVTKSFKLDNLAGGADTADMSNVKDALQAKLDEAFGHNRIKVEENSGALTITPVDDTSSLSIKNGTALGLASNLETSYVDRGKTLAELLGSGKLEALMGVDADNGKTDDKGAKMYDIEINGKVVGSFSENSSLTSIMNAINNSSVGVNVSYSTFSNQFKFTATDTGKNSKVELGDNLKALFLGDKTKEGTKTDGKDAELTLRIDGDEVDVTRSTNTLEVDGLNITLKGEFNYEKDENGSFTLVNGAEAVSFTTNTDATKVVDALKSFVEDYNELVTEIKNAYSTMPQYTASGDRYKPLTDEDMADMSDSAVERYEEKAKSGILFGDRELSDLYNALYRTVSLASPALKSIGIEMNYENGLSTLKVDEKKLTSAVENDIDKVRSIFVGTDGNDGLIGGLQKTADKYGKTTGAVKGILIEKAGSTLSPLSLLQNDYQSKMDTLNERIAKLQKQMADQIDYYTRQFTQMEMLISQMNNQSSYLFNM